MKGGRMTGEGMEGWRKERMEEENEEGRKEKVKKEGKKDGKKEEKRGQERKKGLINWKKDGKLK
jgi:hypothetical protein